MFTQCPDCETYFRVSPDDLEVAAGRVRCSQCDAVFDARDHLLADDDPQLSGAVEDTGTTAPPAAHRDLFASPPEVELGDAELDLADLPPAEPAAAPPAPVAPDEDGVLPELETPTLGGDTLGDEPMAFPADLPPLPVAGRRRPRLADSLWGLAAVVLTLGLGAQWVHAFRGDLAEHPGVGGLVRDTYAALEAPIARRHDLSRISVLRTEVTTHPVYDHVLMLSGVVTNEADFAQDFPLLRVRLDDRWGELVGYRLFEPREYLRRPPAAGARFEPGQPYAMALEVVDPGSEAVGYAIEPCLRVGAGIECTGANPR